MYDVNGTTIAVPRGDSALLSFDLTDEDTGESYHFGAGEYAVFEVSPVKGADAVISKTIIEQTESGAIIVYLTPRDTNITRGDYIYTLRLYSANGEEIDTIAGFPETAVFEVT